MSIAEEVEAGEGGTPVDLQVLLGNCASYDGDDHGKYGLLELEAAEKIWSDICISFLKCSGDGEPSGEVRP